MRLYRYVPTIPRRRRRGPADGDDGAMLRAFVEAGRATMGPLDIGQFMATYHQTMIHQPRSFLVLEKRRRRCPLPRVLFVLDGPGLAGVENRISALRAGAGLLAPSRFLRDIPVLAAPLADLLQHGPALHPQRPSRIPPRSPSLWPECSTPAP
ncbi:hypothetical protein [Streptomyces aureocirculatus]|uniref:hypothetical protein n=1 Tax=Streptomyces aureocirculatus TaxID=67275 RepID=UPI0004C56AE0|nr:hypothetical protein [Streptomyces aureocirculatus]